MDSLAEQHPFTLGKSRPGCQDIVYQHAADWTCGALESVAQLAARMQRAAKVTTAGAAAQTDLVSDPRPESGPVRDRLNEGDSPARRRISREHLEHSCRKFHHRIAATPSAGRGRGWCRNYPELTACGLVPQLTGYRFGERRQNGPETACQIGSVVIFPGYDDVPNRPHIGRGRYHRPRRHPKPVQPRGMLLNPTRRPRKPARARGAQDDIWSLTASARERDDEPDHLVRNVKHSRKPPGMTDSAARAVRLSLS